MTLPNEDVMALLADEFVVGTRNIEKEGHVGLSHGYRCDQTAVGTTNGAGGRNVQLLMLAADGTVVHALPGFWHAADLVPELRLGLELFKLHTDETQTPAAKKAMFEALHRSHLRRHGPAATTRGSWQPFDQSYELERAQRETRDTVVLVADGPRKLKSIPQLVHDRLLTRPFLRLDEFDVDAFVDYGRPFYDNNMGFDRGRDFPRAASVNAKREREKEKADREAAKEAAKAARKNKGKPAEPAGWQPPPGPSGPASS